jgi:hypothetical protein
MRMMTEFLHPTMTSRFILMQRKSRTTTTGAMTQLGIVSVGKKT